LGRGRRPAPRHPAARRELHRAPGPALAEVAASRAAALARQHAVARLLPAPIVVAVVQALEGEAAALVDIVQPGLTHLDLYLPNVLTRRGRLAALLDFEHARWWDPAADFVKLAMWVFEQHPGARTPFWAGYAAAGGRLPAGAARVRVCAGLEWLSGLLYWHQAGDLGMYADYHQRLHAWLAKAPFGR
jgi:aminoglycoside phosphotransferase (APT) family kinase protein